MLHISMNVYGWVKGKLWLTLPPPEQAYRFHIHTKFAVSSSGSTYSQVKEYLTSRPTYTADYINSD